MKFLCIVLMVTSLIAVGAALLALVQPATVIPYSSIFQTDWECRQPRCFCYKEGERQRGECVCTMDLKVLNECTEDRECIERDSQRGRHYCGCHRDSSLF